MKLLIFIVKGRAIVNGDSLRCAAPRQDISGKQCNKLLVKRNEQGQIAGNFKCERCGQLVQVKLAPARTDIQVI